MSRTKTSRLQGLLVTVDADLVINILKNEAARLRIVAARHQDKDNPRAARRTIVGADTIEEIVARLNAPGDA